MPTSASKQLVRDAFYSTVFVFVCIGIFAFNPINLKVFNIISSSLKDIEFTDVLFSNKNPGHGDFQAKFSKDIVLVNAADRGRLEIAGLIDKINEGNPRVLGVDFIFEGPKDSYDDSLLKAAFKRTKKLVLATKFKNDLDDHKPVYLTTSETLGSYPQGYANLMIKSLDKTVRTFRSKDIYEQKTIYPFSLEVVKAFDENTFNSFVNRNKEFETINYQGNLDALNHFNGNDVMANNLPDNAFNDKIVLVGFFGSDCNPNPVLDDIFYTPMNEKILGRKFPDSYGIVIQANIVHMMLSENYVQKSKAWLDWLIGFIICFLHNLLFIRLFVKSHAFYHFNAKVLQLVDTFILIFLCIYLFREFNIKLSASPFIIPVLLTVDLLYFYDAFVQYLYKKKGIHSYFTSQAVHH